MGDGLGGGFRFELGDVGDEGEVDGVFEEDGVGGAFAVIGGELDHAAFDGDVDGVTEVSGARAVAGFADAIGVLVEGIAIGVVVHGIFGGCGLVLCKKHGFGCNGGAVWGVGSLPAVAFPELFLEVDVETVGALFDFLEVSLAAEGEGLVESGSFAAFAEDAWATGGDVVVVGHEFQPRGQIGHGHVLGHVLRPSRSKRSRPSRLLTNVQPFQVVRIPRRR